MITTQALAFQHLFCAALLLVVVIAFVAYLGFILIEYLKNKKD